MLFVLPGRGDRTHAGEVAPAPPTPDSPFANSALGGNSSIPWSHRFTGPIPATHRSVYLKWPWKSALQVPSIDMPIPALSACRTYTALGPSPSSTQIPWGTSPPESRAGGFSKPRQQQVSGGKWMKAKKRVSGSDSLIKPKKLKGCIFLSLWKPYHC